MIAPLLVPQSSDEMVQGHRITSLLLYRATAEGKLLPLGPRVLLRAIWEEEAHTTSQALRSSMKLHIQDAIAFEVVAVGAGVPVDVAVGDVVLNVSISGERVNVKDDSAPYLIVHCDDLAGRISAVDLQALLAP